MKWQLLTYGICLFWSTHMMAQSCVEKHGLADSSMCAELACLYENRSYGEAHSLLQMGTQDCNSPEDILLQARVLAAANEFVLASYFLYLIDKPELEELVRAEYIRIGELRKMEAVQYPGYIDFNEISTAYNDLPFIADSLHTELLNDAGYDKQYFPTKVHQSSHTVVTDSASSLAWIGFIEKQDFEDVGPAVQVGDTLAFVSVLNPKSFRFKTVSQFEIIALDTRKNKILPQYSLSCDKAWMHPAVSGDTIFFSSNMSGGQGGMDIWFMTFDESGFSEPKNLGEGVNSAANEVFPAVLDGQLFYTSDRTDRGYGGLDIYRFTEESDKPLLMPYPMNTAYDDFALNKISADTSLFFSNRPGGHGGDDVYYVIQAQSKDFFSELIGRIEAEDMDLSGVVIEMTKADGTFIGHTTMDAAGYFKLKHIKGSEEYQLRVVDETLPEGSKLKLYDDKGGIVKEVQLHTTGVFVFELLAPEEYYIYRMENEDESVLAIDLGGVVSIDEKLEEGLRIYLEDSNGQLIGVSTTNDRGVFSFDAMKPDNRYIIRSEVNNPDATIRILGENGEVIQTIYPSEDNSYVYVRLNETDQVITITNELNEEVKVSQNEQFNLPVIQFELDRAALNKQSEEALKPVVDLLKKNPNISVDISGHTDSRGADDYNLKLSQDRIDVVIAFLIASGIEPSRLQGKGYGESQLKNECVDGVECTEEEHAVNRRTEMRVFEAPNTKTP